MHRPRNGAVSPMCSVDCFGLVRVGFIRAYVRMHQGTRTTRMGAQLIRYAVRIAKLTFGCSNEGTHWVEYQPRAVIKAAAYIRQRS